MNTAVAIPRTGLEVFEMLPEGTDCELIDNSIVMSPAPTWQHQDLITIILTKIRNLIEGDNIGGKVLTDCDIYIDNENVFRPDVLYIEQSNLHILAEDGKIKGIPSIVIEILSPGTKHKDRTYKKDKYLAAGVKEYWLIDPKTKKCIGYYGGGGTREYTSGIRFFELDLMIAI